ncbi:unnamed protein product [Echinostoma caproni]|uniref:Uncharacterized protein n=1 Tax=Echinostoma caproni TaxID=27848 RepID=A0A183A599_9TREM|nr:unnamed protein product [Echinostoma caproni]
MQVDSCFKVNINPTPSVSAMVNRINAADWHSSSSSSSPANSNSRTVHKTEPIARSSITNQSNSSITGTSADKDPDDPKNYLSELDSVIKELCEANEAAVQATREAARRRHQLGWPNQRNETVLTSSGRQSTNT